MTNRPSLKPGQTRPAFAKARAGQSEKRQGPPTRELENRQNGGQARRARKKKNRNSVKTVDKQTVDNKTRARKRNTGISPKRWTNKRWTTLVVAQKTGKT
jgi:hypothetical protein